MVLSGIAFLDPPNDEDDDTHHGDEGNQLPPAALVDVVQTACTQSQLGQQNGEAPAAGLEARGRVVAEGTATAKADASVRIFGIPVMEGEKHFYFIEWEMDGQSFTNHFMTGLKDIDYTEYLKAITTCGYAEFEGF